MFKQYKHAHSGKSFDVIDHAKTYHIYWDDNRQCWRNQTTSVNGVGSGVQDINESIARFYFLMAWSHVDKRTAQANCDNFFDIGGKLI